MLEIKNKYKQIHLNNRINVLSFLIISYLVLSAISILIFKEYPEVDFFFPYEYSYTSISKSMVGLLVVFIIARALIVKCINEEKTNLFKLDWVLYVLIFFAGLSIALINIYFYGIAGKGESYLNEQNPMLRVLSNIILWTLLLTRPNKFPIIRTVLIYTIFIIFAAAYSRATYGLMALCFAIYSGLGLLAIFRILSVIIIVGAVRLENISTIESVLHSVVGLLLTPLTTPKFIEALSDGFLPASSHIYSKFGGIYSRLSGEALSQNESISWGLAAWISPPLADLGYAIGFSPAAELILLTNYMADLGLTILFVLFIYFLYKAVSKINYFIYFVACIPQILFYMRASIFDLLPMHLIYAFFVFFFMRLLSAKNSG